MTDLFIHDFDRPPEVDNRSARVLLGGKGKSLFDMTALGIPVPPGFTITTPVCRAYLQTGWSDELDSALDAALARLESATGRRLGARAAPLLLSVRSGSAVSMPGMMDTVLNVGLDAETERGLAGLSGDAVFAADCRNRLEHTYAKSVGAPPPAEPRAQLRGAIEAVFRSWNSDRARAYRRIERLADDAGTAVTVQMMVFGNLDDRSGTGVVFSRDPSTGEARLYGDILFRAQGEDVVAGTHRTLSIESLGEILPEAGRQLADCVRRVERHYRDLVEVEFTIEAGRLWILQARIGKRSPRAALRIAYDLAEDPDFPLSRAEGVARVGDLLATASFTTRGGAALAPLARGLAASPGAASGVLATSSEQAVELAGGGSAVILARPETSPSDIEGIAAAAGLLTARGGFASHAAVVARGWGKPAVVGVAGLEVGETGIEIGGVTLESGSLISIDGLTGEVFQGVIDIEDATPPEAAILRAWRDGAAGAGPAAAHSPIGDDDLVLLLAIKGMATADNLAEIAGLDRATFDARLQAFTGLFERPNAMFVKAAPAAAERAAAIIAEHAETLGSATLLLEEFKGHNETFKASVTAWQMRPSGDGHVPNDHSDAAYDTAILAAIQAGHESIMDWLAAIQPARALGHYAARLSRALARVHAGESAYLVSPRIDSYHNVWFELHEYLIRLGGRTRRQEEQGH
jgi:pyruvate,orthophosphate dikinase